MNDCPYILKAQSMHDGELAAEEGADVRHHLVGCAACTAELAELRRLTPAFAEQFADVRLSGIERARLERRLNEVASGTTLVVARGTDWIELARTARTLSAIAASIVLISSIWLFEIPSRHTTTVSPTVVAVSAGDSNAGDSNARQSLANAAEMPAWERAALTLRVDPRPEDSRGGASDIGMADARTFDDNSPDGPVADWFVAGLQPHGNGSGISPGIGSGSGLPHGYP